MGQLHFTNEILFKNFKHLEVQVVPEQKAAWYILIHFHDLVIH